MKKPSLVLTLILLCASAIAAQNNSAAQTAAEVSPEAEKVSVEVVKLFNQRKFDEALPLAQKAVELNARVLGAEHLKTAQAYINVGFVQKELDKKKEAGETFAKALAIFDKHPNLTKAQALPFAAMLESLAFLKFNQGKEGGSEKYYLRALELRQKFNGADAPETVGVLWSLGNLNRSVRDYSQAATFYRQVYDYRTKKLGVLSPDTLDALERCTCTLSKMDKQTEADALKQQDDVARKAAEAAFDKKSAVDTVEGGVVNGKAVHLEEPPYPEEAKRARATGIISVKVMIDETGRVVHACGLLKPKAHPALVEVAEWAAYKSTFTPTSSSGKPVKVTGIINYNFTAR